MKKKNLETLQQRSRSKGEVSVSSSLNSTKYATAQRNGRFLQMSVREIRHSQQFSDVTGDSFMDERKSSLSDQPTPSVKMPPFMKDLQFEDSQESVFPSQDIDMKTLRFSNTQLEADYRIFAARNSLTPALISITLSLLFSVVLSLNMLTRKIYFGAILYTVVAGVFFVCILCLLIVRRNIHSTNNTNVVFFSRVYYSLHGLFYFLLATLFPMTILYLPEAILTQVEIAVLGLTIVLSGDYRTQLGATIYANVNCFILLNVVINDDYVTIFRCLMPLVLTSVLSITVLRIVAVQRKMSFYSIKKLEWIEQKIEKTRNQTKFLLSNLYPVPVMNAIMDLSGEYVQYHGNECAVMSVSLNQETFMAISQKTCKIEIEQLYEIMAEVSQRKGMHKVRSEGLRFTFVSGLFGESKVDVVAAAHDVILTCSKLPLVHTSVSIGIGCGRISGGMLEYSKQTFDVFGDGVDISIGSLEVASRWQIVSDERTKGIWEDNLSIRESPSSVEWILKCKDSTSRWIYKVKEAVFEGDESQKNMPVATVPQNETEILSETPLLNNTKGIDPYKLARDTKGWMGLLGDIRFDYLTEVDYIHSLKTERNQTTSLVQMMAITLCCILFGFVDYGILFEDCEGFEISKNVAILLRIFVVIPLFVVFTLSVFVSRVSHIPKMLGIDHWDVPMYLGIIYGVFSFIRLVLVSMDAEQNCRLHSVNTTYMYTEVYEVGIFFVSTIMVPSIYIYGQYFLCIVLSIFTTKIFYDKMGIPEEQVFWMSIILYIVPFLLFSVFTFSRDFSSRKEYMDKKQLRQGIDNMIEENEKNEQALLSTLNDDLFNNLKQNQLSSSQTVVNSCVVLLELNHPFQTTDSSPKHKQFDKISGIIKVVENVARSYGMEVIKATCNHIIVISRQNESNEPKESECIEKAVQFSFQIQWLFLCLSRHGPNEGIKYKITLDFGLVAFGLIGNHRFVYDCYGEPVYANIVMARFAGYGEVIISDRINSFLTTSKTVETVFHKEVLVSDGRFINTFIATHQSDVLGMFHSQIPWLQ